MSDDLLAVFSRPPPNETSEERATRLEVERWERQRNAEIEEMLRQERAEQKQKHQIRVLLVGTCLSAEDLRGSAM
jgi:hypothetical protein